MEEKQAFLILNSLSGIGSVKIRWLVEHFGSAKAALQADQHALSAVPSLDRKAIDALLRWQETPVWEENLRLVERFNVSLVPYTDPQYPKRLLELPDFPPLLYMKGNLSILNQGSY